jgi:hypothetical protein
MIKKLSFTELFCIYFTNDVSRETQLVKWIDIDLGVSY